MVRYKVGHLASFHPNEARLHLAVMIGFTLLWPTEDPCISWERERELFLNREGNAELGFFTGLI